MKLSDFMQEERRAFDKEFDQRSGSDAWYGTLPAPSQVKSFLKEHDERLIEKIIQMVEREKQSGDMTDEEKEMAIVIWGEPNDPPYIRERRYGFNRALDTIINLLKDS